MVSGNLRNRILLAILSIFIIWQIWKMFSSSREKLEIPEQVSLDDALKVEAILKEKLKKKEQEKKLDIEKVHVTIYYEALCPDSRSFFTRQLLPAYKRLSKHMEVKPVPFGKAEMIKIEDDYEFKCQHGEVECEGNMIHACAINIIEDPRKRIEYLTCMIKHNFEPQSIMKSCGESLRIDYQPILDCYNNGRGKELFIENGIITEENRDKIEFVPTISINQSFEKQTAILKNFLKELCLVFKTPPKGCKQ